MPYFKKVCSAELLNHKFMVPCNPVEYLNNEYGTDWQLPKADLSMTIFSQKRGKKKRIKTNEYHWPNLEFQRKYSDDELLNFVRWYHPNGSINYETTIDYIYSRLSKKIPKKRIKEVISRNPFIF